MATKQMIEEAIRDAQDEKDRDAAGKEYNKRTSVKASEDPRDAVRGQKGYAKGGVTRGDGCCSKGKTKGIMVKMAYGGKAC
jgi:hypothetical protein